MAKGNNAKRRVVKAQNEDRRTAKQLAACMRLTAIGQLTAGVAHELNNPLSVILGYAQSLIHQYKDHESLPPSLATIEREAQRCKRLVQDLLNFSRLPKPGKVMEDVIQVLDGALSLVEAQTRIQHVELIRHFSEDLPMLYVDRHRIQQMIVNLCTNALDAMPRGGHLKISVRSLSVGKINSFVQISISDSGTGISPDIRDRIFDPFFTTKETGKGTGLGLSLVEEVIKEHNGSMGVDSELARGTTFTIRLPVLNRRRSKELDDGDLEEPPVLKV